MPEMKVAKVGYGIGSRELPGRPNVLRAVLGEIGDGLQADTITRIETNLGRPVSGNHGSGHRQAPKARRARRFPNGCANEKESSGRATDSIVRGWAGRAHRRPDFSGDEFVRGWDDEVCSIKLDRRNAMVATSFGEISVKLGLKGTGQAYRSRRSKSRCREPQARRRASRFVQSMRLRKQRRAGSSASEDSFSTRNPSGRDSVSHSGGHGKLEQSAPRCELLGEEDDLDTGPHRTGELHLLDG